ncbi:T-cell-specific guanine nucleotide triphosphate-binding protein 2-like [Echinops telfairi]|uniref:T-cell-specific guanine nucleotide triphosphate-binding protein 2-like n=1 Tax=Echinops telfairi TaxID=9371 RepID=A0ABM1VNA6_ECHTE|nr:T-cell-specific guanine nucleotide triphosphate-binding protein 2-like [Echinops telfairi]
MGQSSSNTPADPKNKTWASSVEEFFKDFKIESQMLSSEMIKLIKSNIEKGDVQGTANVISAAMKEIENAAVNIAVTGESGSGKSSFINALRGVGHEDLDAAACGVVETTMERKSYCHAKIPNVTLWDLPGIGTTKFQPQEYLKKVNFNEYDFFIIICATRFKEYDSQLATVIKKMKKNFYFVRSKVDSDLKNQRRAQPKNFCKDKTLQMIREDCLRNLRAIGVNDAGVFLISSFEVSDYDFPKLETTLLEELPAYKRHIFTQCLPCVTDAAIERRKDYLRQKIWLEALQCGALATIPVMGCISDSDVEQLEVTLTFYRSYFGLDDASLEHIAKDLHLSVEELKANLKSPDLLSVAKDDDLLADKLWKMLEKLCFIGGGLLATGLYFRKTFYLQNHFLDTVVDDAKFLLQKAVIKEQH